LTSAEYLRPFAGRSSNVSASSQRCPRTRKKWAGTPDERKQFIRSYVASIEVDSKNRKIRVGYYDPGEDVALLKGYAPNGAASWGEKNPLTIPGLR